MDEKELLFAEVRLGLQTKEFLQTPVGEYIKGRALKAQEEAFSTWTTCDPNDSETISELQFRARLPGLVIEWLDQVINQAQHAENNLQELEEM